MDKGEIRISIPKRLDAIVDSLVDMGIFVNKSDVVRTALIKYLDDMHLLDQLKSAIETHPIDE